MTLALLQKEFQKYLQFKDKDGLDLILACVMGNSFLRGRIWLLLIGSSGAGKTSLLDPLRGLPSTYFLDDISQNSFLSGYMGGKNSLLHMITFDKKNKVHTPKTMVFSDFTTILSKNQEARGEILSQFRVIYDGKMDKATGVGTFTWAGKLGALCAATPNVYNHLEAGRAMGERFLYYVMSSDTDKAMLLKQRETSVSPEEITDAMKPLYYDYCFSVKEFIVAHGIPELKLTPEQYNRIEDAAIFCVRSKASVRTDFKSGKVAGMPEKASATRDNRSFMTLLQSLHLMDCHDADDPKLPISESRIKLIEKCAYSAISTERRKILESLAFSLEELSSIELSDNEHGLNLPAEAIEKFIAPLHAVGIINKTVKGNGQKSWSIHDAGTRQFIKNVSETLREEQVHNLDIFEKPESGEPDYQTDSWEAKRQKENNDF